MAIATNQTLKHKIHRLLSRHFPGARIKVQRFGRLGKYSGRVIWKGFQGDEQIRRQRSALARSPRRTREGRSTQDYRNFDDDAGRDLRLRL